METTNKHSESFDENQSIQVIKEMIAISQNKLKNDGILFIVWGWIFFISYFFLNYLTSTMHVSNLIMQIARSLRIILPVAGIFYSAYYIFKQQKKVQTYIGISLRYVWISLFISLVLVNLIQFNVLSSINFELQHPIFMVFIAFAITITGGILRYKLIIAGGIIFAVLAYIASHFELQTQLLIESVGWILAFIIPGHILYSKKKS